MLQTIAKIFCPLLMIVRLAVLAWPEEQNLMMVQFSETHGPSKLDLAGIGLIMLGYLPLVALFISKYSEVKDKVGGKWCVSLMALTVLSWIGIVGALSLESDWMLWLCVAVSICCQAVLIYHAAYTTANTKTANHWR
jgi:hypothetical protein